jgi:hypothetical protein
MHITLSISNPSGNGPSEHRMREKTPGSRAGWAVLCASRGGGGGACCYCMRARAAAVLVGLLSVVMCSAVSHVYVCVCTESIHVVKQFYLGPRCVCVCVAPPLAW